MLDLTSTFVLILIAMWFRVPGGYIKLIAVSSMVLFFNIPIFHITIVACAIYTLGYSIHALCDPGVCHALDTHKRTLAHKISMGWIPRPADVAEPNLYRALSMHRCTFQRKIISFQIIKMQKATLALVRTMRRVGVAEEKVLEVERDWNNYIVELGERRRREIDTYNLLNINGVAY
jgi:hypothetical protein